MKKIDDDDDDDDDDEDDGTCPFQRRSFFFNSCYPKNIQDSVLAVIVTSLVVTQKFVRTP